MENRRIARCACGQLQAETEGDPTLVSVCHCHECQRRTGSPFGAGAWFERSRVRIYGTHKSYTRTVPEGRRCTNHFCPECGGPFSWEADGRPGMVAIAVGMFADRDFPPPNRSVYEERKHPWFTFTIELEHMD
jgi:hypothetical protein